MSKARARGTRGENYFLSRFVLDIWPLADRAPLKGINDGGDYVGVPLVVEAKDQASPRFLLWARQARSKAVRRGTPWILLYKGDARTGDGCPVMMVDADFGKELIYLWHKELHQLNTQVDL